MNQAIIRAAQRLRGRLASHSKTLTRLSSPLPRPSSAASSQSTSLPASSSSSSSSSSPSSDPPSPSDPSSTSPSDSTTTPKTKVKRLSFFQRFSPSSSSSSSSSSLLSPLPSPSKALRLSTRGRLFGRRLFQRFILFKTALPRWGRLMADSVRNRFENEVIVHKWILKGESLLQRWRAGSAAIRTKLRKQKRKFVRGNLVQVYFDGDAAFSAMWNDIAQAKTSIFLEMYTLKDDIVGSKTIELLLAKRQEGIDVRLVIDFLGSFELLHSNAFTIMQEAGIKIIWFNPMHNWARMPPKIRNHRKILVVDKLVGYCGGMNIGDPYCGQKLGGTGFYRDTMVRMYGPIVNTLLKVYEDTEKQVRNQGMFDKETEGNLIEEEQILMEDLQKSESAGIPPVSIPHPIASPDASIPHFLPPAPWKQSMYFGKPSPTASNVFMQVLESHGFGNKRHIQQAIRKALFNATKFCYICTPYLLPTPRLSEALIQAAIHGIDVRIITSGKTDIPSVRFACSYLYRLLTSNGVKIYELMHPALHSKTITVDGVFNIVGSFNMDIWSDRNAEVAVAFVDRQLGNQMKTQFLEDLKNSVEVHPEPAKSVNIFTRALQAISYYLFSLT